MPTKHSHHLQSKCARIGLLIKLFEANHTEHRFAWLSANKLYFAYGARKLLVNFMHTCGKIPGMQFVVLNVVKLSVVEISVILTSWKQVNVKIACNIPVYDASIMTQYEETKSQLCQSFIQF